MQVESGTPQYPPPGVIMMHTTHNTTYLPLHPSPLSPRSPNIPTASPFAANLFGFQPAKSTTQKPGTTFAARFAQSRPPRQTHDAIRQRRRDAFMARIRDAREDQRWHGRRDELWRLDHLADLRRRYLELERLAGEAALDVDRMLNDEMDLEQTNALYGPSSEDYYAMMDDVEAAAMLEQMELDELVDLRREDGMGGLVAEYESDEYDDIFMELISEHPEVEHAPAQMGFMHF